MNKIIFISHYSELYGANRSLLSLIKCIKKENKYVPLVLLPENGTIEEELNKEGIKYYVYKYWPWVDKSFKPITIMKKLSRNLVTCYKLKNIVSESCLIYSNSSVVFIGFLLSFFYKKKHIWHIREFLDIDYGLNFDLGKIISKNIIKTANNTICISKSISTYFELNNNKNNHVIYNGIETSKRMVLKKDSDSFVFLIIGLITENKGQLEAVEAMKSVVQKWPNTKLNIVGKGDTLKLEKAIDRLNLNDKINLVGETLCPNEEYDKCDAVLMCSKYEGLGRVTIEAMANRRPVIGYNSTGTRELILHGINGYLYNNTEELSKYMEILIENPIMCTELGKNGEKVFIEKFTVQKYCEQIGNVIKQMI